MAKAIKKNECNMENGVFVCRRFQEEQDGSKTELAKMSMAVDGQCNPIINEMSGEDSSLAELHEFMVNKTRINCKKKE